MIKNDDYSFYLVKTIERGCKNGNHKLQKIFESGSGQESTVVRWCSACGSVVVDTDYDGRTSPGAIMKMVSPDIIRIFHPDTKL